MKEIEWLDEATPVMYIGRYYLYDKKDSAIRESELWNAHESELWKIVGKGGSRAYHVETEHRDVAYEFWTWDRSTEVLYEITDEEAALYKIIGCPDILSKRADNEKDT